MPSGKEDNKGDPQAEQRPNGTFSSGSGSGYAIVAFVGPVGFDVGQVAMQTLNGQAAQPILSAAMADVAVKALQHFRQRQAEVEQLQKKAASLQKAQRVGPAAQKKLLAKNSKPAQGR